MLLQQNSVLDLALISCITVKLLEPPFWVDTHVILIFQLPTSGRNPRVFLVKPGVSEESTCQVVANKHIAPFLDAVLVHLYKAQGDDDQKVSTISRLCQELIKNGDPNVEVVVVVVVHHEWFTKFLP